MLYAAADAYEVETGRQADGTPHRADHPSQRGRAVGRGRPRSDVPAALGRVLVGPAASDHSPRPPCAGAWNRSTAMEAASVCTLRRLPPGRSATSWNRPMSWRVSPVSARSAVISPTTLQNLKPWPGARRRDHHPRVLGVQIEDEVLVRGVGEHAGAERHRRAGAVGEVALGECAQERLVLRRSARGRSSRDRRPRPGGGTART